MFEAHGVPVLAGVVADTPEEARAAAEEIGPKSGGVVVVKAQVKTGGRGKAGGVKVAKTADEAAEAGEQILGMDIKGHTVHQVMVAQGAPIAEEYYFSVLLDRANRTYLAMCSKEGGMEIEQLAVERPEALARVPVDPNVGHRRRQGPRDRRRGRVRRGRQGRHRGGPQEALGRLPRGGRDAGRGQPAGQDRGRADRGARRQGHPRRERRLPARRPRRPRGRRSAPTRSRPRPRRRTSTTSSSTARSASSATAPGWSCPPSTSSPTPVRSSRRGLRPRPSRRTSSTSAAAPPPR